jgi:SAM-dependent methyltransferase
MIKSTLTWIEKVNKEQGLCPARVLDVGSLDYNGSPRYLFPTSGYVGVDIKEGASVDEICDVYSLSARFGRSRFDAVLCLHVLEHLRDIWEALREVRNVLTPGGHLYVAMPTLGYPEHDYPGDYWRATEQCMREVIMGVKSLWMDMTSCPWNTQSPALASIRSSTVWE